MPVTTKEVGKYVANVISEGDPNNFSGTIWLSDTGGATIGFLRFYKAGSTLLPSEFRADLGYPLISYPSTAFPSVIDLLRNEKPVYFTWYDSLPTRAFGAVGTSREPVGESE